MHILGKILTAVLLTLMVSAATADNCTLYSHGLDCPLWLNQSVCLTPAGGSFFIRRYPSYKWVSFNTGIHCPGDTCVCEPALDTADLAFPYLLLITSKGDMGVKATSPVFADITTTFSPAGNNSFCAFSWSFFLDYVNQANPAMVPPASLDVIQTYPLLLVAMRTFAGLVTAEIAQSQISILEQQLSSMSIKVNLSWTSYACSV